MITDNISLIRKRIGSACARAGRDPREVCLVAVTKTFPASVVNEAASAGVSDIGENYVQELLAKRGEVTADDIRWHFIGHLQTNKVRSIAGWIDLIHAVDSVRLAEEIDKRAAGAGRRIDILIEVNSTGESSKYGVQPGEADGLVRSMEHLRHVRIRGLMTMGLFDPDPEVSRPLYRRLRLTKEEIAQLPQENMSMDHLSMGMTGDFEVAIEEGATLVRIGTALFGRRKPQ